MRQNVKKIHCRNGGVFSVTALIWLGAFAASWNIMQIITALDAPEEDRE